MTMILVGLPAQAGTTLPFPALTRDFGQLLLSRSNGAPIWQRADIAPVPNPLPPMYVPPRPLPRYEVITNAAAFGTPLLVGFLDDSGLPVPGLDPSQNLGAYATSVGALRPNGVIDVSKLVSANTAAVAALGNPGDSIYRLIFSGGWTITFSDG